MSTLAEKLDLLFETIRKPDGKEYSYEDIEKGTDKAITAAYVWKLRTGKSKNPGYKMLAILSRFFDVPVTYFFSDESVPNEREFAQDLQLARALRKQGVEEIAIRVSDLDKQAKQDILAMIEYVRQAQGVKDSDRDD